MVACCSLSSIVEEELVHIVTQNIPFYFAALFPIYSHIQVNPSKMFHGATKIRDSVGVGSFLNEFMDIDFILAA